MLHLGFPLCSECSLAAGLHRFGRGLGALWQIVQVTHECNRDHVLGHLVTHFELLDAPLGLPTLLTMQSGCRFA